MSHIVQATILLSSRADSRLAPSQWETSLQSNAVSHWLGTSLESVLFLSSLLNQCNSCEDRTIVIVSSFWYWIYTPTWWQCWCSDICHCYDMSEICIVTSLSHGLSQLGLGPSVKQGRFIANKLDPESKNGCNLIQYQTLSLQKINLNFHLLLWIILYIWKLILASSS